MEEKTTINIQDISKRFVYAFYALAAMRIVHTRAEFCAAVGMAAQNFRPIEDGKITASLSNLCGLMEAYDINPNWLFKGEGEMR